MIFLDSPMNYDEWMNRPVYKTQCKTAKIANELAKNFKNVSYIQDIDKPPFCLRVVRQYRTLEMQAFRDQVAEETKKQRKKNDPFRT